MSDEAAILAARAAEAWSMMVRPEEPMPVYAAVDWLRQQAGTDDVAVVKLALFRAAADRLEAALPFASGRAPDTYSGTALRGLRTGGTAVALDAVATLRRNCHDDLALHKKWRRWCDKAAAPALALCDELEGL